MSNGESVGKALLERVLALLDNDDLPGAARRIRAYEAIFVAALVAEYWCRALPKWGLLAPNYYVSLAVASLLGPVALLPRWRQMAFAALAVGHGSVVWNEFPAAGNHAYLEVYFCALAAMIDLREEREQVLYLRAVRWMVVVILFFSGVQKVVHGYYFGGEHLAFSLWIESFRPVLRPLMSAEEFQRILAYSQQVGDGPYRVDSIPLLLISNAVWMLEIALAPLLLVRRTRLLAVLLAMGLLLAIELGARELFFGMVFVNAILFFAPARWHERAMIPLIVFCGVLLLMAVGILPGMRFT